MRLNKGIIFSIFLMCIFVCGGTYAAKGDLHTGRSHTNLTVAKNEYLIVGGKNMSRTEHMFYYVVKNNKEVVLSGTVEPMQGFATVMGEKSSGKYQVFYRYFPEITKEGRGRVGLFKQSLSTAYRSDFYNLVILPKLGYAS